MNDIIKFATEDTFGFVSTILLFLIVIIPLIVFSINLKKEGKKLDEEFERRKKFKEDFEID